MSMQKLPALFVGHGSPFNLFTKNPFTQALNSYGDSFFKEHKLEAIVIISAHWATKGTLITGVEKPDMVYDYYGFPDKFYEYIYPAKGSPEIANKIEKLLPNVISTTDEWGIDHAATIILENILPSGEIPVIELSLDIKKPLKYHYELGKKLAPLRNEGILFIGSGNLIHTFREIESEISADPLDWVVELDNLQKRAISMCDLELLFNFEKISLNRRGFQTLEHYIPMLYILGMKHPEEQVNYIYEGFQHGSISHRSFEIKNKK
jgi:4,5-DOPA dioxygenase extradiol